MAGSMITCHYCPCLTQPKEALSHLTVHILHDNLLTNHCKLCNKAIILHSKEVVVEHINMFHNMDIRCPFCKNAMQNMDHLYKHLATFMITIYHCDDSKCIYQTCNKNELSEHLLQFKHRSNMILEECKFICNLRTDILLSNERPSCLESLKIEILRNMSLQLKNGYSVYMNEIKIDKKESIYSEVDNIPLQVNIESKTEQSILPKYTNIKMDYSDVILGQLLKQKINPIYDNLMFRLKNVRVYSIGVAITGKEKSYICIDCKHSSSVCFEDIQKHILNKHCHLNMYQTQLVMMSSLHDSNFQLYSDNDITNLINERKIKERNVEYKYKSCHIFCKLKPKYSHQINLKDVDKIFQVNYSTIILRHIFKDATFLKSIIIKFKNLKHYLIGVKIFKLYKVYVCMDCGYSVCYNSLFVRRHILSEHCKLNKIELNLAVKSCSINWRGSFYSYEEMMINKNIGNKIKFQENDSSDNYDNDLKETFNMDYSEVILKKLCKNESKNYFNKLLKKLKNVRSYLIEVIENEDKKSYMCVECDHLTKYIHGWIRRHILSKHCLLNEKEITLVMMSSMYYQDLSFYTDQDILDNINVIRSENNEDPLSDLENDVETVAVELSDKTIPYSSHNKIDLSHRKKFSLDLENINKIYPITFSNKILRKVLTNKTLLKAIRLKLKNLESNFVGVYHTCFILRIYVCMNCKYSSYYLSEIKKHILETYCDLSEDESILICKACKIDFHGNVLTYKEMTNIKSACQCKGVQDHECLEMKTMEIDQNENQSDKKSISSVVSLNSNKPKIKETFQMDYSNFVLQKLCDKESRFNYESIIIKLKDVKLFPIAVLEIGNENSYLCSKCQASYIELSHEDVRKHILSEHCLLSDEEVHLVMMSSIYYKELWLYSNNDILNLLNVERLKKEEELLSDVDDGTCDDQFIRKNSSTLKGNKWRRRSCVEFTMNNIERIFAMFYSKEMLNEILKDKPFSDNVFEKLESLPQYLVGVSEVDNCLIYACITCKISYSYYNHIRRHIINVHCDLNTLETTFVIKACKLHKKATKIYDSDNCDFGDLTIRQILDIEQRRSVPSKMKECDIDSEIIKELKDCRVIISNIVEIESITKKTEAETFHMDYSDAILRIFFKDENINVYNNILLKLKDVRSYLIGVISEGERKSYICMKCQYVCTHGHRLIRRHILSQHCLLYESEVTLVMMTSLYGTDLKLSNDHDIINFINGNHWDSTINID